MTTTQQSRSLDHASGPVPQNDPKAIADLWHILPKPSVRGDGWLVFTSDFIVDALQRRSRDAARGSADKHASPALRIGLAVAAVLQAVIMLLSRLPITGGVIASVAQHLGSSYLGFFLRSCYWKTKLKRLGQNTLFDQGVEIWGAQRIEIGHTCCFGSNVRISSGAGLPGRPCGIVIGDYTSIGPSSALSGGGRLELGDFVAVMSSVYIYTATSALTHPERRGQLISLAHSAPGDRQYTHTGTVIIDDYAIIENSAVILPESKLGRGSIVHPFTEINGTFPAFANIEGPGKGRQNGWRTPRKPAPPADPVLQ